MTYEDAREPTGNFENVYVMDNMKFFSNIFSINYTLGWEISLEGDILIYGVLSANKWRRNGRMSRCDSY